MTAADRLLVVALCTGLGGLYAALWQPPVAARQAEIRVGGEPVVSTVALDTPQVIHIDGVRGTSILEVADHRIRFVDGPCRNRICIHTGWLSHTGDGTACIPNRVSLSLIGGDGVDAVSF